MSEPTITPSNELTLASGSQEFQALMMQLQQIQNQMASQQVSLEEKLNNIQRDSQVEFEKLRTEIQDIALTNTQKISSLKSEMDTKFSQLSKRLDAVSSSGATSIPARWHRLFADMGQFKLETWDAGERAT